MIRWSLYNVVHDRGVVSDEMVEEVYRLMKQARGAFASFQKSEVGWGGLRTNYAGSLRGISAPTLIVHGAHDTAVPVAWARRANERIAGSELRIFPDCGHMPPRERPEEFNRVVARFLRAGDAEGDRRKD